MGGDVRTNRTRHGSNQSRGLVPAWLVGPVGVLLVAALAAGLLVATADEAAAHGLPGDHVGTPASAPIRFRQGIEAPFGKADLPAGFSFEKLFSGKTTDLNGEGFFDAVAGMSCSGPGKNHKIGKAHVCT